MSLLDKLRQMLTPREQEKKSEYLTQKQDDKTLDTTVDDGNQTGSAQSCKHMRVARLTLREHDLYLLLLEGFTLKESAKQLGIKYSTANTHMTSLYRKLGVKSRAELIINYRHVSGENTPIP